MHDNIFEVSIFNVQNLILSYLWFGYIRQWIMESQLFSKKYFLLSKKELRFKFLFVNRFESRLLKLSNWNDSNVYTLLRWIQSIICLLKVAKSRKVFSNRSHIQNNQKLVDSNTVAVWTPKKFFPLLIHPQGSQGCQKITFFFTNESVFLLR